MTIEQHPDHGLIEVLIIKASDEEIQSVTAPAVEEPYSKPVDETALYAQPTKASKIITSQIIHDRYGHPGRNRQKKLEAKMVDDGYTIINTNFECDSCDLAKSIPLPYKPVPDETPFKRGECFELDLSGIASIPTMDGGRYRIYMIDRKTGYTFCTILKTKNAQPIYDFVKYNILLSERITGNKVQRVKSDGGTEFTMIEKWCHSVGIDYRKSPPRTHQCNPRPEVKMRSSKMSMDCMMVKAGVPPEFWGHAAEFHIGMSNLTPIVRQDMTSKFRTPYEMFYELTHDAHYLRQPFCLAVVYIPPETRRKQDLHGMYAIFVGYDFQTEAYKFYANGKIIISRNAKFRENEFCFPEASQEISKLIFTSEFAGENDSNNDDEDEEEDEIRNILKVKSDNVSPSHVDREVATSETDSDEYISAESGDLETELKEMDPVAKEPDPAPQISIPSNTIPARDGLIVLENDYYKMTATKSTAIPDTSLPRMRQRQKSDQPPKPSINKPGTQQRFPLRSKIKKSSANIAVEAIVAEPTHRAWVAIQIEDAIADTQDAPKHYAAALRGDHGPKWQQSVIDELKGLHENGCWSLIKKSEMKHDNIVDFTMVFVIKPDGTYKSRFVARGDTQKEIGNTFATVAGKEGIKLMLVEAARNPDTVIYSVDVEKAFIQSPVPEDKFIYVRAPIGFVCPETGETITKEHVYHLHRWLYGFRESAHEFSNLWHKHLDAINFVASITDWNIHIRQEKDGTITRIASHVDDGLITGTKENCEAVVKQLQVPFKLKVNRGLNGIIRYVGINIIRDGPTIRIHQNDFIEKIYEEHADNIRELVRRPHNTPMDDKFVHKPDDDEPLLGKDLNYPRVIGQLMYLTQTRTDCVYAINTLSKYVTTAQLKHYKAAMRIIAYIFSTRDYALILGDFSNTLLELYSDASYAMDEGSVSRTGTIVLFRGSVISSASKSQQVVALSSAEAEYIAITETGKSGLYILKLIEEVLLLQPLKPITIFTDNKAAIEISKTTKYGGRTKHIQIKYHKIREWITAGIFNMEYVSTEMMLADALTKPLARNKFNQFRDLLHIAESNYPVQGSDEDQGIPGRGSALVMRKLECDVNVEGFTVNKT
jgi:hypothetical protein